MWCSGANLNRTNINRRTPLMKAASLGHVDVVKALVEEGANMFLLDKRSMTALDWARRLRHAVVATALENAMEARITAERRVILEAKEAAELDELAATNQGLANALSKAITAGAELDTVGGACHTKYGWGTVAHLCAVVGIQLSEMVTTGSVTRAQFRKVMDFARLPPDTPFWLDVETPSGWTVLTKAAAGGDLFLCDILLRKLVIVRYAKSTTPSSMCTALTLCLHGQVDYETQRGLTALTWACICGHLEVVGLLLRHGANIDQQTGKEGKTPLFICAANGHSSLVLFLMQQIIEK